MRQSAPRFSLYCLWELHAVDLDYSLLYLRMCETSVNWFIQSSCPLLTITAILHIHIKKCHGSQRQIEVSKSYIIKIWQWKGKWGCWLHITIELTTLFPFFSLFFPANFHTWIFTFKYSPDNVNRILKIMTVAAKGVDAHDMLPNRKVYPNVWLLQCQLQHSRGQWRQPKVYFFKPLWFDLIW